MDRRHLPAQGYRPTLDAGLDVREHRGPFPSRERLSAPRGAPNVLLVLIDDMGYGAPSAFGGPCRMPTADRLAEDGLRYSRFHVAALCSPTRAALMTGRNHHSVGMGTVCEMATDVPGYDALRPASAGTLAQTLSLNGYATGAFGKWHQTPPWEQTAAGPFDHWPTQEGFDTFYGFLGGEADQFTPTLVDGLRFVDPPRSEGEGYHLSEDLVDRAIDWVDQVRTFDAERPWFTYLSFGATHAPFHVPRSWRDRYRGEFAHGWDEQRERTLARQKELGIVPSDTELGPWAPGVPHWDELDDTQRLAAERLMEVYASFAEHTDAQVGRLVEHLRATGELDNTVVLYVLGDNGASAEGGLEGTLNETIRLNGIDDSAERIVAHLDTIGGPEAWAHYPVGWALAMDTPYQWSKQVASHLGGTRNGLVVHWPDGISAKGEVRHQWHHVIDVVPTLLEVIGVPQPDTVNGVAQDPIEGVSFAYSLNEPEAAERHVTQYFEMFGNRGIFHHGWTAVTKHRTPWLTGAQETPAFEDDVWELYDTHRDWSQAHDLAAEHPEKLAELQALFLEEARRHQVLPMDDRMADRFSTSEQGRPGVRVGDTLRLGPRAGRLREAVVPALKNRSFRIQAALATTGADDGVLVKQGCRFAGWTLYVVDGRPHFTYNYLNLERTTLRAPAPLDTGNHEVTLVFAYDGGGIGKGGTARLLVDDVEVDVARIDRTVPFFYSHDSTLDVGIDRSAPVTAYPRGDGFAFSGEIAHVTLSAGDDAVPVGERELLDAVLVAQ
jgi:arylsulfatase A-like enzyme